MEILFLVKNRPIYKNFQKFQKNSNNKLKFPIETKMRFDSKYKFD